MIDTNDNQTQALPLDQAKRGRGRPATGKALSPAEKQKAYRERLANKGNVTEIEDNLIKALEEQNEQTKYWTTRALQAEKRASLAEKGLTELGEEWAKAKAEQGNVTQINEKGYNVQFKAKGKRTWKSLSERGAATCEHFTEESAERSIEALKRHFPDDQYRIVKAGE